MNNFDVIIIGAGPIGLVCGIEAQKAGLTYTIIEKGCLVNSLFHYPYNMTFFSTSDKLEIGGVPFISHGPKPNRVESLEYYRRVCSTWKLNVKLYEEVKSVDQKNGLHLCVTTKGTYVAKAVIFAVGFYDLPYLLNIPGENLPKVKHYYDEPHPYYAQRVAVIGASNSAVDVALETWRKGALVTMIIRDNSIKDSVKYWVKPDIENRIAEKSINVYYSSQVIRIDPQTILIETPEGEVSLDNDFVLAMTGYQPPFGFMKRIGMAFQDDEFHTPVYNTETMETNIKNLYLAGVICGGLKTNKWFIENSRVHATMIIEELIKKKISVN